MKVSAFLVLFVLFAGLIAGCKASVGKTYYFFISAGCIETTTDDPTTSAAIVSKGFKEGSCPAEYDNNPRCMGVKCKPYSGTVCEMNTYYDEGASDNSSYLNRVEDTCKQAGGTWSSGK